MIVPGAHHPETAQPIAAIARRLRVPLGTVAAWCDQGLAQRDGLIDPFAALSWASWAGVAVVRARWQRYVQWMSADARLHARRLQVHRRHRAFTPPEVTSLRVWLPGISSVEAHHGAGAIVPQDNVAPHRIADDHHQVALCAAGGAGDDDLRALLREIAGTFRYAYRQHGIDESLAAQWREQGTCLDACLSLAHLLDAHGRAWRLRSGVTAHSTFANPHFWLEVETSGGAWCVCDPTIPAIARMAGMEWNALLTVACGPRDTRRVLLETDNPPAEASGLEAHIGMLRVGQSAATACLDWLCGRCEWRFSLKNTVQ